MDRLTAELSSLVADIRARQAEGKKKHPLLTVMVGVDCPLRQADYFTNLDTSIRILAEIIEEETGLGDVEIKIVESAALAPNEWALKIRETQAYRGKVRLDRWAVLSDLSKLPEMAGSCILAWLPEAEARSICDASRAALCPSSFISYEVHQIIKHRYDELLDRQRVADLLAEIRMSHPALVQALVPSLFTIGEISKILRNLLTERVSIADMIPILETLADQGVRTKDLDLLTELVRTRLAETICNRLKTTNSQLAAITICGDWESLIKGSIQPSDIGPIPLLSSEDGVLFLNQLRASWAQVLGQHPKVCLLVSTPVRRALRLLIKLSFPDLAVLSWNEIHSGVLVDCQDEVKHQPPPSRFR